MAIHHIIIIYRIPIILLKNTIKLLYILIDIFKNMSFFLWILVWSIMYN